MASYPGVALPDALAAQCGKIMSEACAARPELRSHLKLILDAMASDDGRKFNGADAVRFAAQLLLDLDAAVHERLGIGCNGDDVLA
jgi:hypothetical protein